MPGILARREEENCTAQLILCACGRVRAICVLVVPMADGGPELVLPGQLALGLVAFTIAMSKSESPSSRGLDLALPELYPMGLCLFLANFIPPKIPEAALCGGAAGRTAGLELGGGSGPQLGHFAAFLIPSYRIRGNPTGSGLLVAGGSSRLSLQPIHWVCCPKGSINWGRFLLLLQQENNPFPP